MNENITDYLKCLGKIPSFLVKYLSLKSVKRLQKVGYFCGMDYASKEIYSFPFYISRYDHSLTTALITWKYSHEKKATIAAFFHDIATPCFSHVIDYMNQDYEKQESTEEKTSEILKQDQELLELLKQDGLVLEDIKDFKKYSIVDNERPKLCADRLDGIILTSLAWTKELTLKEIADILNHVTVFQNEDNKLELGFKNKRVAEKILYLNHQIDEYCHSHHDAYMMMLLANITKLIIKKKIIQYDDLYYMDEEVLFDCIRENAKSDQELAEMLNQFYHVKLTEIPNIELPKIKRRVLNPLINGVRYESNQFYFTYQIKGFLFLIVEEEKKITKISLGKQNENGIKLETDLIKKVKFELEEYFEGKRRNFDIPLKLIGTEFQKKVWNEMMRISYGNTVTYQELARMCGNELASRAVGNACHNNRILILVPCHRVVAKHHLGGYEPGIEMKIKLLEMEGGL